MLSLAHRGICSSNPGNTLESFSEALSVGADGIETDVRLSAIGELILFHDRYTVRGTPVDQLSRSELSIEVGYNVPTVQEALEQLNAPLWNLEIKAAQVVPPLQNYLNKIAIDQRIFLTSFVHSLIFDLIDNLNCEMGLLIAHNPTIDEMDFITSQNRRRIRSIVLDFETLTVETVAGFRSRGQFVWAYNIDKSISRQHLEEYELNGIITDHIVHFVSPEF